MQKLQFVQITMGCDPEFFFTKKGSIIGAEKLLPKEGFAYDTSDAKGGTTHVESSQGKVVIDGVQAELNPRPNTCRANIGNELSTCFRQLYETMVKDGIGVDFGQTVLVSEEELKSLCDKSRRFGCAPSNNVYNTLRGENSTSKITVNPEVYRYRSAGGHIHLGASPWDRADAPVRKALKLADKLVPVLDIILGNTCVLIDRNESNIERRKVYGKAGEYRLPKHGLEYRTLSNFWLQAYPLMGFVMGLARQAVCMVENDVRNGNDDYVNGLIQLVNLEDIARAINTNDFELAMHNFKQIEPFILAITPESSTHFPLCSKSIGWFYHFVNMGLPHWFNHDPLEHWIKLPEGHSCGWENFLENVVAADMVKTV